MAEKADRTRGRLSPLADGLRSQGGAVVVLLIGVAFIAGGLELGKLAGRFPVMLGGVAVALALLEIVGGVFVKVDDNQKRTRAPLEKQELKAIAWIFLTIVAIYIFGILAGALVSTVVFCRFIEGRGILKSIANSIANVFVIWFAFSYLAGFDLYRGAIF